MCDKLNLLNLKELLKSPKGTITDVSCPKCNGVFIVRQGETKFLGCGNFPKCRETRSLVKPKTITPQAYEKPDKTFDVREDKYPDNKWEPFDEERDPILG